MSANCILRTIGGRTLVVAGLRASGTFASLDAGRDLTIPGLALPQALVFQFWRYSRGGGVR